MAVCGAPCLLTQMSPALLFLQMMVEMVVETVEMAVEV